jgi:hypothetical protein
MLALSFGSNRSVKSSMQNALVEVVDVLVDGVSFGFSSVGSVEFWIWMRAIYGDASLETLATQFITSAIRQGFMERRMNKKVNAAGPIILSQNGYGRKSVN